MGGFWDRVAGFYDFSETANRRANLSMERAVVRWVPSGSRVLDCAAGTGTLSLAAAMKAGYVLCTDLSLRMLAEAKKKALRTGRTNIGFAKRDIFSPPPEQPFDVVIAGNVLHLLDDPQGALRCLLAAVRKGGRVILPTYLQGESGLGFRAALAGYRVLGFRPKAEYTLGSYRELLGGCGAELVCLERLEGRLPVGFGVLRRA